MRRLQLILLAYLQLCRARSRSFNIHEDLLAFPQFEVVFADDFISEKDAKSLLDTNPPHPTYSADFSQPTVGDTAEDDNHGAGYAGAKADLALTYEVINMSPHRYLCSIPMIEPTGPENQTATELAKAEEARELSRAAVSGWSLLNQLEESCLYFMSGWWSYRFCNNREIVQFHALPSIPDGQPPRRDPHTAEYVLGRIPAIPAKSETHARPDPNAARVPAELQIKGDQRYLVQKLEGGTICDLTGRDRTIEVQYHCAPGTQEDRIGWIKEVTICAYVMVINTPRLCDDVAFLPPRETKANPITCQLISDATNGRPAPPLLDQGVPPKEAVTKQAEQLETQDPTETPKLTVGGVVIGGRRVISAGDQDGQPPVKLAPPRNYLNNHQASAQERLIEVLVHAASKEDGGKVDALTKEELEKLDLKPEVIEEMREQMRKLAGDSGWQLEVVELPGDEDLRELRGWIHEDEVPTGGKAEKAGDNKGKRKKVGEKTAGRKNNNDNEGSEEKFFKEEL
ncbi:Protein OS-9-like protein [Cladobotryum mycophilum]|uniref:Endoplasmic reticulum lectin n=1 Tax=Cladobotryum mycophilum TaxID=491253 RepID=A0ABR0SC81_9HYPO